MKIEWIWDGRTTGLTDDHIDTLNDDLTNGYVVGYVEPSPDATAHFLVLKKYDGVGTYTIFDPWNKKEFRATSTQLFGTHNSSEKLPYADNSYGKMFGFYRCY